MNNNLCIVILFALFDGCTWYLVELGIVINPVLTTQSVNLVTIKIILKVELSLN